MYFENRLENYTANLLSAEKELASKASADDVKRIHDRFEPVLKNVSQYCWDTAKLMENGVKLIDNDDSKKLGKREWQSIFMDKYLGMIPLIRNWAGTNLLPPLYQEVEAIYNQEFYIIGRITALLLPEYIYRSYQYRQSYNEMAQQLTTAWARLCAEMNSHGNVLHGIAISIADSLEGLNTQLNSGVSQIFDAVKYRGTTCSEDEWFKRVRETSAKISQIHDDLEKYERLLEDNFNREIQVMEMYDYILEGTFSLVKEYNRDIAERDYQNYKPGFTVDEKDCRDFINDVSLKGYAELNLFCEVFKKFVNDFKGKFINNFDDNARLELFKLADRAGDWARIYDCLRSERLMENIQQTAYLGDQILEDCARITSDKTPQLDGKFKDSFRSEMSILSGEAQKIKSVLFERIKYYLYDIFYTDAMTKELHFVCV